MKFVLKCCVPILVATIAAVVLRLPQLEQRPMHCDEAVHAVKFGQLLEKNLYVYDKSEYHGPTLNYFTLVPAKLGGILNYKDLSEVTLRVVPVFFGIVLVILPLLLTRSLGLPTAFAAALFLAISPAMVFYSRYYIQEMLLTCFTLGAIVAALRYAGSRRIGWAISAGIFCGLMHATKETAIIAFASMLLALVIVLIIQQRQGGNSIRNILKNLNVFHILAGLAAAFAVSAIFYSSFFTNPKGILDSFSTYLAYFARTGQNQFHVHPWYYYFQLLMSPSFDAGFFASEIFFVVMAAIGLVFIVKRKLSAETNYPLLWFIAFYTVIMAVVYSAIPYKTPWCMLSFLTGLIILAAVGTVTLIKRAPAVLPRLIVILLLLDAGAHLVWQTYLTSYKFSCDTRNPYVYAQPTKDIFNIAKRIKDIAAVDANGNNIYIQVSCPQDDYWPLPWYLREFTNVGYFNKIDNSAHNAAVIISNAVLEPELLKTLYETSPAGGRNLYVPLFNTSVSLRPKVELRGYITKDINDRLEQRRAEK